jgi:hypothetical protein
VKPEDARREFEARQELRERSRDLEDSAPDRAWNAWAGQHAAALEGLGEPWLGWIRRLFLQKEGECKRWFEAWYAQEFLREFLALGLSGAILSTLENGDYEKQSRRHWDLAGLPELPRSVTLLSVLQEILAADEAPSRREVAAKWLPFNSSRSSVIPALQTRLTDRQREVRWWSAIHLAHLEPGTLPSTEQLREALGCEWVAWSRRNYDLGCSGRGEAALALAQLGERAMDALPDLKEGACAGDASGYHEYDVLLMRVVSLLTQGSWDAAAAVLAGERYGHIACQEMGWAAIPLRRKAKRHDDHGVRQFALQVLEGLVNLREDLAPGSDGWTPNLVLQMTAARAWGHEPACFLKAAAAAEL